MDSTVQQSTPSSPSSDLPPEHTTRHVSQAKVTTSMPLPTDMEGETGKNHKGRRRTLSKGCTRNGHKTWTVSITPWDSLGDLRLSREITICLSALFKSHSHGWSQTTGNGVWETFEPFRMPDDFFKSSKQDI